MQLLQKKIDGNSPAQNKLTGQKQLPKRKEAACIGSSMRGGMPDTLTLYWRWVQHAVSKYDEIKKKLEFPSGVNPQKLHRACFDIKTERSFSIGAQSF